MKAGNLPDLIKYLTVIYFSLFSVFLCYTDDARVTEFRKYAVQSNSYGIINYNIHSQALFAMSDLICCRKQQCGGLYFVLTQEIPLSGFESHDRNRPQSLLPAGK